MSAMRIIGPPPRGRGGWGPKMRGGRREKGTEARMRRLSSPMKAWPGVPIWPKVLRGKDY